MEIKSKKSIISLILILMIIFNVIPFGAFKVYAEGETNYNLIRTATYATVQMLDRAFQDFDCKYVVTQINAVNTLFSDVLEQMGFYLKAEQNGCFAVAIEKDMFLKRKYLF